jgi:hypothetical protein
LSCNEKQEKAKNDETFVVARFNNEKITKQDIMRILPDDISQEDSTFIVDKYIEEWLGQAVLFDAAKKTVKDTTALINKVNDFRKQLYIHYYTENYIYNQIDKNVKDTEIEKFYNEHINNYILPTTYIKAHYLTMDASVYVYYDIWEKMRASTLTDIDELKKSCIGTDRKVYSHEEWIPKDEFLNIVNYNWSISDNELPYRLFFDYVYEGLRYFVKIDEFALKGSNKPIEFVRNEIKQVIISKRKQEKLHQTRNKLMNEAVNSDNIVINKK